jgi:hypothetical protein
MALRCAHGETGTAAIREGRRSVELTPAGGSRSPSSSRPSAWPPPRGSPPPCRRRPDLRAADADPRGIGAPHRARYERRRATAARSDA